MRAQLCRVLIGALLGSACAADEPAALDAGPLRDAAAPDPEFLDRDGDGLCDWSELDAETDPEDPDTDGDGLPDLVELGTLFDARDARSPAAHQRAVLQAAAGASLRFSVRATVLGEGQGLTGFFEPLPSAYGRDGSASDYFVGAEAVSADPGDNVRGFDAERQRFGAVVGETRLGFDLRFAYGELESLDCARAYPFRYALKSDQGETLQQRLYVLLVMPPGAASGAGEPDFCLPARCF